MSARRRIMVLRVLAPLALVAQGVSVAGHGIARTLRRHEQVGSMPRPPSPLLLILT